MAELIAFLTLLNSLTPLGIIALLTLVLFYQARNNHIASETAEKAALVAKKMSTNDLHDLPEIAETLRRMEVSMERYFALIIATLNRKA